MKHQFGIVLFVTELQLETNRMDLLAERPLVLSIPEIEADDPFCYNCGRKKMNVGSEECSGPDQNNRNYMLPDLLKVH